MFASEITVSPILRSAFWRRSAPVGEADTLSGAPIFITDGLNSVSQTWEGWGKNTRRLLIEGMINSRTFLLEMSAFPSLNFGLN